MSNIASYNIPCPKCKSVGSYQVFHSVNTNINGIVEKLLNDEINFGTCNQCSNRFQIKAGLLFNNMNNKYALYYNPVSFEQNEQESENIKRMFGPSFYLANPTRFKDWDLFKSEIINREGIKKHRPIRSTGNISGGNFLSGNYWSCDICDGDSDTGCLYFDPTECPRHT